MSDRCPICGGYEMDGLVCKYCGTTPKTKPKFELPQVDTLKLGKLLREKEERERRESIPRLSDCPKCKNHSLFYDKISDNYDCMNTACKATFTPTELKDGRG